MNIIGVLVGGIAVAYALVEILPPDVLTPPDGSPAVPMLVTISAAALLWNVLTWAFGIPNSSSHCVIRALSAPWQPMPCCRRAAFSPVSTGARSGPC